MSLVAGNNSKGEKSKKFQSLNINNIYQGASSKPQTKSAPQKHGLQSLGKVPTARRAPANLPSLKAENCGNDPTINLVPTTGSGWGGQQGSGQQPSSQPTQQQQQPQARKVVDGNKPEENSNPEYLNNAPSSENTSAKSWVTTKKNFYSQRSPLFGQEFPSLETASNDQQQDKKVHQQPNLYPQPPPSQPQPESSKPTEKYGPGPSLRPQSFGHWSFGGKGQTNNSLSSNNNHPSNNNDAPSENLIENSRTLPPPPLVHNTLLPSPPLPRSLGSVANTLKFDVSANSPLKYFGGPVVSRKQQANNSTAPSENQKSSQNKPGSRGDRATRDGPLFQASIIDRDKLKRMDDFESNDDDWTRSDETFDYNKKIDSDNEEELEDLRIGSSWTDQLNQPQKENRFDYPPPPTLSQTAGSVPPTGRKLNPGSGPEIPFFDDEDQRRVRKNEEVLQSIERARRRREEEEQKYKGVEYSSPPRESRDNYRNSNEAYHGADNFNSNSDNFHPDNFRNSGGDFRDFHGSNKRQQVDVGGGQRRTHRQQSCSSNSSREENAGGKHASQYKQFDVIPPSQEYNERKSQHHDQGGYGPRKPVGQPSSVPPRFKRHRGELQQFKRGYQGKGSHYEDEQRGSQQQQQQAQHHIWERQSSESEPDRSRENSKVVETSELRLPPPPEAEEETPEAPTQASPCQFVALSTSNSKDNFETNSSYSSSSVDRYPSSNAAAVAPPVNSTASNDRHSSYEDRRSAETDLGKATSTTEKANVVEQPNNIRRSGPQDHQGRKRDLDSQPQHQHQQQQQHHYTNRQHKDEYDYNSIKRNGRDKNLKEEHYDSYRDHRGPPRGGRGSSNGTGQHSSQQGGPYSGGRSVGGQRGQPQKKIVLPSRGNRDGPPSQRPDKRTSDEEPEDIQQQTETKHQQEMFYDQETAAETEKNNTVLTEIVKPVEKVDQVPTTVEHEAPSQEAQPDMSTTGWFAPRGQPSRRGRGGISGSGVTRSFGKDVDVSYHGGNPNEEEMKPEDWDSSSDRSFEDSSNKRHPKKEFDNSRRGGHRKKEHGDEYTDYSRHQNTSRQAGPPQHAQQPPMIGKGGMEMKDKRGPPPHQLTQQITQQQQQQVKQIAYERRQNKLPPRLAKQKEQNRMKYTARDGWTMDGMQGQGAGPGYQWDQLGQEPSSNLEFNIHEQRSGFRVGETPGSLVGVPPIEGVSHPDHSMNESHSGTVQTIIFENTNFKGAEKMFKGIDGPLKEAGIQMPLGFGGQPPVKPEDSGDLKLDFTFEPTDMPPHLVVDEKSMNRHPHPGQSQVPVGHPASAEDLNLKIASVKKVWETGDSTMSPGPDGVMVSQTFGTQGFVTDDKGFGAPNPDVMVEDPSAGVNHAVPSVPYDKSELGGTNVAKVRPQILQQPQMPPHPHHQQQLDVGRGMGGVTAGNVAFGRLMGSGGLTALHSPPSMMNQPPSMYQAFQLDPSRGVTNQLYPYQSVMLQSSAGLSGSADLFGPPPNTNQFRMQSQGSGQYGGQQSTGTTVLLSQSLMSSAIKPNNQIGPIGTKGGNPTAFQQNSLGTMPGSATSPLLIPFDSNGASINYLASTIQRSPSSQTAFYQALANNQAAANSRQQAAFNMQGFAASQQSLQQQQLNAQLRSQGLSYMKPDSSIAMKNPRNDSLAAAAMGANLGLQAHHQMNTQAAANKVATSLGLNMRSHMNSGLVAGHGGPVGMTQQPNTTGPNYSPTPIQRPQGKPSVENEESQESSTNVDKKKLTEE